MVAKGATISTVIGTQTVTDNFNRADVNPIAGNWTDSGSSSHFEILTNAAQPDAFGGADADAIYSAWTGGDNHYSQAELTLSGTSATAGLGVSVRHSSTASVNTMYRLVLDAGGNYELSKFITGSKTSLRTGTVTYGATKKLGLSISGSTLKIWYDGAQVGTDVSDSGISSGVPGISYSSVIAGFFIDNWDAGTVP